MAELALAAPRVRPRLGRDEWLMGGGLTLLALYLTVTLLLPLALMLAKSTQDRDGAFVGLAHFSAYFSNPALSGAIGNSVWVSALSTLIVIVLAFGYAYALHRSCIPFKGFFRLVALLPLLAPSLLPAIALVYLFGNQGALKGWLFGDSIYGPIGIVIGSVFWTFPHALILIGTALATADARLYEASDSLGASRWRTFTTVTLSGARYGLISAVFVVFTLIITDFGVPKVIGGHSTCWRPTSTSRWWASKIFRWARWCRCCCCCRRWWPFSSSVGHSGGKSLACPAAPCLISPSRASRAT
jgi:iron(III) transport system permease protein